MTEFTHKQIKSAEELLEHSGNKPEDFIRSRIGKLLDSLDVDYEINYLTSSGPADIFLPRRRMIIETKASGLVDDPNKPQTGYGNETPREQLERYLKAEIEYERNCPSPDHKSNRPWKGILTDGRVWHVWGYSADDGVATTIDSDFRPYKPEVLISRLQEYVRGELVGKPWIPSDPKELFKQNLEKLRELHAELPESVIPQTETKRRLWIEMLITTSMAPESEAARQRLFVAHSFLVALARGVTQVLATPSIQPRAEDILADGFVAWIIETPEGRQWGDRFFKEIFRYEWRRRPGDVLRPLYEAFVDENDRKAFGEFYTPDWLADLLVQQVLDDEWCENTVLKALAMHRKGADVEGIGVLDPSCGSGTFLYYAARRILGCPQMSGLIPSDKAAVVCSLVHGLDVHPVAAEITRATLLRALPTEPPQGKAGLRIHEGDALMLRGDDENALFQTEKDRIRIATPKGIEVFLPKGFVENVRFADNLRRLVLSAKEGKPLPYDILEGLNAADREAVTECQKQFVDIIKSEGNSVWAWYILNTTGPYRLKERKVDRIVANPPWVKMANIQVKERKQALERFAAESEIDLWMGGKQAPHFDIAQLFIKRTRKLYLVSPESNPAAWLVKKSALKAGSWEKFRDWHKPICKQTVDLEAVKPFGSGDARRCCVLFENRASNLVKSNPHHIVARLKDKGLPLIPQASLKEVQVRLAYDIAPTPIIRDVSDYVGAFRQGATITPKILTVVGSAIKHVVSGQVKVTTVASQHRPWSKIDPQSGMVPKAWVHKLIVSKAVIPYAVSSYELLQAIIPVDSTGALDPSAEMNSEFWKAMEAIYDQYRGSGSGTPKTLLAQIDYGKKLSTQLVLRKGSRKMVIYPSSGDNMKACRICVRDAIVDTTLYRHVATSEQEAAYLVCLMNADCLNEAFRQSRTSGRHFHLNPWEAVPIPKFDHKLPDHIALVHLGKKAEKQVEAWLSTPKIQFARMRQVALSKRIREHLRGNGTSNQIDEVVRRILPDQAQ